MHSFYKKKTDIRIANMKETRREDGKTSTWRIGSPVEESGRNGVATQKENWRMENIKKDSRSKSNVGAEQEDG